MKYKEIMMRLTALGISTTLFCATPMTTFAAEPSDKIQEETVEAISYNTSEKETRGVADDKNFVIENGVLTRYKGKEQVVTIPASVTSIGTAAFGSNNYLTSVNIPNSVTSIEGNAFFLCKNLTSVNIPNSVTSIGEFAFQGCSSLTSIDIPKSVTSMGTFVFSECTSLTSVNISASVTSIGQATFSGCTSLTSVNIPKSVTSIGDSAFWGCSSLTSIDIPASVTSIGDNAFTSCKSLTSINIPASVTSIGKNAFVFCKNLTIYGYAGSYAQTYAQENNIPFVELKKEETSKNPFSDVVENAYYYNPVLWAVEKGITSGLSQNKFAPEQACTRGQVVTFLWRAMGKPEPKTTQNPFKDVSSSEYYYKAVLWALENGITSGVDSTHFAPDKTVTRSQFVTFLHRAQGRPTYKTSNPFKDVQKEYYYDAILWAYEKGITTGLDATTFGTEQSCTRGQVVTFLYRGLSGK